MKNTLPYIEELFETQEVRRSLEDSYRLMPHRIINILRMSDGCARCQIISSRALPRK